MHIGTMRKLAVILLTLTCDVAFAQPRHEISAFLSHADGLYRATRGYGVAYDEMWTPRFSTQIAVGVEEPEVCVGGSLFGPPCTRFRLKTYPVDLAGRYHFANNTRWTPYVGAGVRYVRAPHLPTDASRRPYPDHVDPQIVGGVQFLITPSFAIVLDGKQRLGTSEQYDPWLKISAGLDWRF